jgi:Arc/MetJ family transcription regulator
VTDLTFVATWAGVGNVCFMIDAFSRMIVGRRVAGHMRTPMVLDAIEMARWSRGLRHPGLRCHFDAGSQLISIRYGERLAEIGAVPSIGTVGDSDDNALAETVNGYYEAELIRGPDRTCRARGPPPHRKRPVRPRSGRPIGRGHRAEGRRSPLRAPNRTARESNRVKPSAGRRWRADRTRSHANSAWPPGADSCRDDDLAISIMMRLVQHLNVLASNPMRTTITLADDVAAAVAKLRRERGVGISEAVNDLLRSGLNANDSVRPFRQKAHDLGSGVDVSNVAEAIETLDGPAAR